MASQRDVKNSTFARLSRVRRAIRSAQVRNFVDGPVHPAPPTVTQGSDAALTTYFSYADQPGAFNFLGGPATSLNGGYTARARQGGSGYNSATIEWCTDAPKLLITGTQGTSMLVVDGYPVSLDGLATEAAGGGVTLAVDWDGVRKVRRYRWTMPPSTSFYRVGVDALSRVWAPSRDDMVRAALDGDSYMTLVGASLAIKGMGNLLPELLGFHDVWNNAAGATGWLQATGISTLRQRINNIISADPDIVIIAAGGNDSPTGIQAEVTTYLAELRAALPYAPVILFGPWPAATGPSADRLSVEAAISAAVSAHAHPLTKFVPLAADPLGAWMFGTGSNGSGTGNAALYLGADAVHPNDAGHEYFARRIADGAARALLGM